MKLIDKEEVVAAIKKIYNEDYKFLPSDLIESVGDFKDDLLTALDTIEVKDVDLENSVKGRIDYPLIGVDFPNIYPNYKELKDYCDKNGIKDEDEVKIIITKTL